MSWNSGVESAFHCCDSTAEAGYFMTKGVFCSSFSEVRNPRGGSPADLVSAKPFLFFIVVDGILAGADGTMAGVVGAEGILAGADKLGLGELMGS